MRKDPTQSNFDCLNRGAFGKYIIERVNPTPPIIMLIKNAYYQPKYVVKTPPSKGPTPVDIENVTVFKVIDKGISFFSTNKPLIALVVAMLTAPNAPWKKRATNNI